jgi:hypothetical protein
VLSTDEYIEQTFFFESFLESLDDGITAQEFLYSIRGELLATTQLHKAVDFMLTDVRYTGVLTNSMSRLNHYFSPFQSFVISESERDNGRLDFRIALQILAHEAKYRSGNCSIQGIFFYQFETICRNRLGYVRGLDVLINDDIYDNYWKEWLTILRRQIGFVPLADMIFYRSEYYKIKNRHKKINFNTPNKTSQNINNITNINSTSNNLTNDQIETNETDNTDKENTNDAIDYSKIDQKIDQLNVAENAAGDGQEVVTLFGEREGRIAFATRDKEPSYLFSALSRHLGYPSVPHSKPAAEDENILPILKRRIEQLENRIQILEEEQRGGIDLNRYIKK